MSDLDQPDLAAKAAHAALAPNFDLLVGRARRRRRTAVIGAGLAVAAVAAGVLNAVGTANEGQAPVAPSPTTHHVTTAPTSAPTTTQPSRNVPESGPCPPTGLTQLPRYSGCASVLHGDFDGDGSPDTFIVYRHPLDAAKLLASPWHAMLLPAEGPRQVLNLSGSEGDTNMRAVAATDVNRDGSDDAFVLLHEGAATYFLGIVTEHDGHLVQTTEVGGKPFELDLGSVVRFGSGATCRRIGGRAVIVRTGYFERGGQWHFEKTFYRWEGSSVVQVDHRTGLTTARAAPSYADFSCLGVRYVGSIPDPPAH